MKLAKTLISLVATVALVYALNRSWGPVPALGDFLNPFTGFWQNGEAHGQSDKEIVFLDPGLKGEVTVRVDDTGVPHIFAGNNHDLFFAQGYLTARDRLWQMDLQVRAASGRLSEVLGPATLDLDKNSRKLGMGFGAEANIRYAMNDPATKEILLSYTEGVNAYISSLSPKDYPVEYKLLGYRPEAWKPINTMYMLEQMMLTLAGRSNDLSMTAVLDKYGMEVVKELFPDYPLVEESPIIPVGTPWNFPKVPIPQRVSLIGNDTLAVRVRRDREEKPEGIGSNNWAVGPGKSSTGYPILANDPHLELTLPSIWYQVQLHAPGINVCGVSLPGIPSVIIGFNEHIAWGVTNVDADVYDLYKIKFKDASREFYFHANEWKPTTKREELIYVKGELQPVKENIIYTHHGPVTEFSSTKSAVPDLAVRWIGHEPGNGILTFYGLNTAKNYDDYRKALSTYVGPAQNFVFADDAKDIAMTVNGRFPLKYKDQGKFLLDGTQPTEDWQGWIPADQNPHVKNPPRGFVSSANQSSTDPTYPYYLNWVFAPSERGIRINERLTAMTNANADSLRGLQNDNFSVQARTVLPKLLSVLKSSSLNPAQKAATATLAQWNYQNSPTSVAASIFESWMPVLRDAIWEDDFRDGDVVLDLPTRDRTEYLLLKQEDAKWFDDVTTPEKEAMRDIVTKSFRTTLDTLTARHGSMSNQWQWSEVKGTEIRHLTRKLKPFNAPKLTVGGGSGIVNAITKRNGPSWRMVVELGPKLKAYGIYPGGQSGNPGSPFYMNLLKKWEAGELNELVFLRNAEEENPHLIGRVKFKKN